MKLILNCQGIYEIEEGRKMERGGKNERRGEKKNILHFNEILEQNVNHSKRGELIHKQKGEKRNDRISFDGIFNEVDIWIDPRLQARNMDRCVCV